MSTTLREAKTVIKAKKKKIKVDARTPTTQQKRPLSPVISARNGDNFPPQNRTQSHEKWSLQQTKNWRDSSMPQQRSKPDNSTSAARLHPTHRSPFWLLDRDHTPCNQALRRPGGPSVHSGVCDEDGCVCLGKREEEEEEEEEEEDIRICFCCRILKINTFNLFVYILLV